MQYKKFLMEFEKTSDITFQIILILSVGILISLKGSLPNYFNYYLNNVTFVTNIASAFGITYSICKIIITAEDKHKYALAIFRIIYFLVIINVLNIFIQR